MSISVTAINAWPPAEFVRQLGPLFEHSPWIAERTAGRRPFVSTEALHAALSATVDAASLDEQVALIRAHPDLAGKLAIAGQLTAHSTVEQQSARLDRLTPAQFAKISALNEHYRTTFGFPFVICVKDHTQETIFGEFERRAAHERGTEIATALQNIQRIAWHRLQAMLHGA